MCAHQSPVSSPAPLALFLLVSFSANPTVPHTSGCPGLEAYSVMSVGTGPWIPLQQQSSQLVHCLLGFP